MDRQQLEQLEDDELDDMVAEIKCQEASDINNEGREEQINYILNHI